MCQYHLHSDHINCSDLLVCFKRSDTYPARLLFIVGKNLIKSEIACYSTDYCVDYTGDCLHSGPGTMNSGDKTVHCCSI